MNQSRRERRLQESEKDFRPHSETSQAFSQEVRERQVCKSTIHQVHEGRRANSLQTSRLHTNFSTLLRVVLKTSVGAAAAAARTFMFPRQSDTSTTNNSPLLRHIEPCAPRLCGSCYTGCINDRDTHTDLHTHLKLLKLLRFLFGELRFPVI